MNLRNLILALSILMPFHLFANSLQLFDKSSNLVVPESDAPRFTPYGVNYLLFQKTQNDDESLEGHYSFRYTLFDCRRGNEQESWDTCKPMGNDRLQFLLHFTMTGEFDFYAGTRDSGPVVNRTSNPALHFQWIWAQKKFGVDYLDVGLEHRSDGQVVEIDEVNEDGRLRTQVAYENNDHAYFDGLSRGSNYISFNIGSSYLQNWTWKASAKLYLTKDTDVNWGTFADKNVDLSDYDIVNISVNKSFSIGNFETKLVATYTAGKKLFKTDSLDLSFGFPIEHGRSDIPLFLNMHIGPMDTLSNYTKSVFTIGFGLAFSWY